MKKRVKFYNHHEKNKICEGVLKKDPMFAGGYKVIYKNMILNTVSNRLIQFEEFIKLKSHHIQQINPKNILKKGYAIIRDKQDKIIKNSENAKHHRLLTIEMIDGRIEVERRKKA